MQSGVVLNPWAIQTNIKEKAYRLCEKLGHTNKDPKSIVEFLRTIDVQKLIDAQEGMVTNEVYHTMPLFFDQKTTKKKKKKQVQLHIFHTVIGKSSVYICFWPKYRLQVEKSLHAC